MYFLNKERFGANSILAVSMGVAKTILFAAAKDASLPLYRYLSKEEPYVIPLFGMRESHE